MMNLSFEGMSGRVELDEHGDLKESISAMNYVIQSGGTMRGRRIGVYDAPSRRYLPVHNSTVVWPGNVLATPADMAASPTAPAGTQKSSAPLPRILKNQYPS
jgi:hypothetical protein